MRGCLIERSPNRVVLQDDAKQMNGKEMHQQPNMLLSSQEYVEKLQKENMTLIKALAHRNKLIELSGVEFQKLRINLRNMQEKNLQLAQANSQMLAELNANRDRLKALQHELGCKNVLLKTRKVQLEEQTLPCSNHASKDKVPANASDGDDMNHRDTKRKQTLKIKPSGSSDVKPIHVNEKSNSKRRVSGVIDTTIIPEETSQTEDDIETGVVSRVANQIVDNVIDKKFVLDAANLVEDSAHSKRQRARRRSTMFDVEETKKLIEMDDDTKKTKETASLTSRRRSARLKPEEAEPFNERGEVKETIKRRMFVLVSSRRESAMFEPEVTLNATDDARSLLSEESIGSRSEAVEKTDEAAIKEIATDPSLCHNIVQEYDLIPSIVSQEDCEREPSEIKHDTEKTTGKRRLSTRRQSTKSKSQTATEKTDEAAIKETATDPSLCNNIVQEYDLIQSTVPQEDCEREPSEIRYDTKETNAKRRVSRRRQSPKGKSQTAIEETNEATIKDIVQECDLKPKPIPIPSTVSQEEHEKESKKKAKADEETETEGMVRRTSVGRPSRHAAVKVQSYKEVSLKVKMRRNK